MKQIFQEEEINQLQEIIKKQKSQWKTIVWTNGCFDILHPGHLETFKKAKEIWDILIVWLNGDKSPYWKTKPGRPINDEKFRSKMLEGLKYVDYIYIFNDETPTRPVDILKPDYVLKGGDYYINKISEDFIRWLSYDKKQIIKQFNEIVESKLVKKEGWIIDITWIYKFFVEHNLFDKLRLYPWFMQEGYINVKNGWKVILVPVVWWYSTTKILEKIRPKRFFDLIMFWKNYRKKLSDLWIFVDWFYKKLRINYFASIRTKITYYQGSIYRVEFWKNIWTEVNKKRPAIIISNKNFSSKWDNLWVIPLTTLTSDKKIYEYDVVVKKNIRNNLKRDSIARVGSLKEISKKRVFWYIGKIGKEEVNKILENIQKILKK